MKLTDMKLTECKVIFHYMLDVGKSVLEGCKVIGEASCLCNLHVNCPTFGLPELHMSQFMLKKSES